MKESVSYQLHIFYDNGDPEQIYTGYKTIEDAEDMANIVQDYPHVVDIILEVEYK